MWATPEDLPENEKAACFLEFGFPLQKVWVMQNLPLILIKDTRSLLKNILVKLIQNNIINWPEEMQLDLANGILKALELGLIPEEVKYDATELSLTFLSFYSRVLHTRWLPVFQYLLPQIPINLIKTKLTPEVMLLSDFTQKAITRQISCHLLACLAGIMGKDFKGPLLQRVKALSQDTNPEVREEMCKAWIVIIKALGRTVLEDSIYFDILKLIEDEVEAVKSQGITLLIKSLEFISDGFFNKEVSNVLISHIYSNTNPKIEEAVAQNIGFLIAGCHGQLRPENIKLIQKFMAKDSKFKKAIAFNYPGIAKIMSLCADLKEIAVVISNDSDLEVRTVFASGFHEVLNLNKNCKILRKVAAKLIEDNDTKFFIFKKLQYWSVLMDSSQLLLKYIKILTQTTDWRTSVLLLKNFQNCFENFDMKEILDHLVPLVLHKMIAACWPIKVTCSEILANIIRNTFYIARKYDVCSIVKEKLAHSSSCFDRLLFIEFAMHMARINSRKFFMKHFFDDFLSMAYDNVHSVQIKFLMAAPLIAVYIQSDQIISTIVKTNYVHHTARNLCNEALSYFKTKEFLDKFEANMANDRVKEQFEIQQELQEVKELENSKRKAVDELAIKTSADNRLKNKKLPVKVRIGSESIDPKPRGTRSTALIKPIIPIKKK